MFSKRFCSAVVALFAVSPASFGQCAGHANLNPYERGQFIELAQRKSSEVYAQFLSMPGCGKPMLDALKHLRARMDYSDERSGYALMTISTEKLLGTLDIAGIEYASARAAYPNPDASVPQSERKAEPVPEIQIPYPRVANTLPPDGPFYDAAAIGLPELWKEHPEADGRGVRVAVPDEGFDLLHPALLQSRNADGQIVPKIADLGSLAAFDQDAGWVEMNRVVDARDGQFEAAGRTWRTPLDVNRSNGTYRFGIFKETLALGPQFEKREKKVALSVGVLWDEKSGRVWVDTDGDGSFADHKALGDYGVTHDIAWFGTKSGEDDNRIPFGVKIDAAQKAIYVRVGGDHGALVGGPLAANKLTGGLFDGAAPSAQLVDESLNGATAIADMVRMFARPDVDVINRSGGIGRSGYTGWRTGLEDFAIQVLEREIAVYQKPFVAYSAAPGTIHVNDFSSAEELRRNRQVSPPYKDTMNSFVWDQPDGYMNSVLAPSTNLETESRYDPLDSLWPDSKRHAFADYSNPPAPDGYVIGANPSPAIPVVTGVIADLISEARRENVRYDAERLNNAIFTGAKLLPGFPVSQQGYGLVNAANSWDQLTKMAKADDPKRPELTRFTVSRVMDGKSVEVEGFNQDLGASGTKVNDEIWITRRGGYAGGRKYTLSLGGDAKTFELLDHEVTLIRDKAVRVRFRASGAPGWNIALLELHDAEANVVMEDVPLEVKAPEQGEMIAPGVVRITSDIPPLTSESRFLEVGDNVEAARYVMRIPFAGPDSIRSAPGIRTNDNEQPSRESVDAVHHVGPMETFESLEANDDPGIKSVFWENRGRPEYRTPYDPPAPDVPIHAELTVTKYAVGIQREGDSLTLTNKLAEVVGRPVLYDARLHSESMAGVGLHASVGVPRELPVHLSQWRVEVRADSLQENGADVFLLDCTDAKSGCSVAAQKAINKKGSSLVVDNPKEGSWRIVFRTREPIGKPVEYRVREAMLTPSAIPLEASDSKRASGTTWSVALPAKESDAQYAAFHIAADPNKEVTLNGTAKSGLDIALTPLDSNAP